MHNHSGDNLPNSEREALRLINEIGVDEVQKRFDRLTDMADARYKEIIGADPDAMPDGYTAFNLMSNDEKAERYLLLLAIQLSNTDSQEKAHQRIIARINVRRERHRQQKDFILL